MLLYSVSQASDIKSKNVCYRYNSVINNCRLGFPIAKPFGYAAPEGRRRAGQRPTATSCVGFRYLNPTYEL